MVKRIIPCLDIKAGRVVKGKKFVDLEDAGDPVALARFYDQSAADELVLLDIAASSAGGETMEAVIRRVAREISLPFIVGGGIQSVGQIRQLLEAGAARVSFNTPAVENPALIREASLAFGRQRIVVAIDARWDEGEQTWEIYTHGGRKAAGISVLDWALQAEKLGAGEILLTSMDADGGREGFDLPLYKAVCAKVNIPVIASGGAGKMEDFARVLSEGHADAALAASVFHYRHILIKDLKKYLFKQGLEVVN